MAPAEANAATTAGSAKPATPHPLVQSKPAESLEQATPADQTLQTGAAPEALTAGADFQGPTVLQQARATPLPMDTEDWELSEGGLPEGSALSGSKALLEDYPEDEANSKKPKKTATTKGKKTKPKA